MTHQGLSAWQSCKSLLAVVYFKSGDSNYYLLETEMYTSVLDWLDHASADHTDRIAYADAEQRLTFGQVDQISRAVGDFLLNKGALPAEPVVVMGARNVFTPACYLGVVRAGCFYAPADAELPAGRLQQILEVIDAAYMIVSRTYLDKAQALGFSGKIFVLEDILEEGDPAAYREDAVCGITETSPLYVIFTSGSTGKPKGVITSHYSLMCYIDAVQSVLQLDESDVLGNQAPLDYIAAVRDIYLPLYTGVSSFIIPKNEFAMPDRLFGTLNSQKVTTLCWSTAGLEIAARLGAFKIQVPEHLRRVIFSGAVISNKYLRIWQDYLPEVRFFNQYGPTEATASCTVYEVKEKVEEDTRLPIGRPYPHYRILLLDEQGKEPACGDPGEICVGGPVLALGYYRDPERTSAAFIQNPLNDRYRDIIYRTGDLGRLREDGLLEFLGRKDRQIKHLGHRIELDEIEIEAGKAEGVDTCCAMYDPKKSLLYLFYCGQATSKEIALMFRADMPAFMVPRKIIRLEEMPTLANGKIDMKALREMFS